MSLSLAHLIVILLIILLLFGAGRLSLIMEEFGKGLGAFKKAIKTEDKPKNSSKKISKKSKNDDK